MLRRLESANQLILSSFLAVIMGGGKAISVQVGLPFLILCAMGFHVFYFCAVGLVYSLCNGINHILYLCFEIV